MSPITPAADSIAAFVIRHACDPQAVVRSVAGWQRLNERHLLRAVQRRLHPSCSHAASGGVVVSHGRSDPRGRRYRRGLRGGGFGFGARLRMRSSISSDRSRVDTPRVMELRIEGGD